MLDQRLIIIAGKGGVGRTTVAAALGTVLARRGRRVLLAHVRSKGRLAQLLGRGEVDEEIRELEPGLWAVNMNPRAALREKGLQVLRFQAVYRAVMENRLVRYFLRAVPALAEYSMLGKAWYHTTEMVEGRPRFDTVVFDGPAMGHLLTMLKIPRVITETVPDGPLAGDALKVRELLEDPARTSMWIVTLAEEMPVQETLELYREARGELGIRPERIVVNSLYPDDLEGELAAALDRVQASGGSPALAPLLRSAAIVRSRRRINQHYLELLQERIPLPLLELPHLFVPELDRAALDLLAARIEAAL